MAEGIKAGDIIYDINGDTSGLRSTLDSARKNVKKLGVAFTAVGGVITAAFSKTLKLFGEQEAAELQLGATLRSTASAAGLTGEELTKMASALQEVSVFGDEAIIGAESLLLTFKNIGKDVFPDTLKTVLDMSQALGTDLKSSSIQLGKALNDPITGLSSLSRVGITFDKEQTKLIHTMAKSGDMMGAQRIILAELSSQFGGSALMATVGYSGKLQQLKNSFGDLLEEIGGALAEGGGITGLIDGMKELITGAIGWIKENPEFVQTIVKITAGIGALLLVMGPLAIALSTLATPFGLLLGAATAVIAFLITKFWPAIKATAEWVADNWEWLKESTISIFNAIVDFISSAIRMIVDFIGPPISAVVHWVIDNWQALKEITINVFNIVVNVVQAAGKLIWGVFRVLGALIGGFINGWKLGFQDVEEAVSDNSKTIAERIADWSETVEQWTKKLVDVIEVIVSTVSSAARWLGEVGGFLTTYVITPFKILWRVAMALWKPLKLVLDVLAAIAYVVTLGNFGNTNLFSSVQDMVNTALANTGSVQTAARGGVLKGYQGGGLVPAIWNEQGGEVGLFSPGTRIMSHGDTRAIISGAAASMMDAQATRIAGARGRGGMGTNVNVSTTINNPVMRTDQDVRAVANQVSEMLDAKVLDGLSRRGSPFQPAAI